MPCGAAGARCLALADICVASALFAAESAVEGLLALSAVGFCSAVIDAELLASSARAKLGVRAVARAIAVSSARARFAMP